MNKEYVRLLKNSFVNLKNRGAFHLVLAGFMTKFASFFGSIFIVRLMSKHDYGILSYYENFYGYFVILVGAGLTNGLLRYMVIAKDIPEKKSCFLHAARRGSLWNIFLVGFALLFLYYYPHPESFRGYYYIAVLLTLCIPFSFFLNAGLNSLRGLFDNKNYSIIAFSTSCFLIIARVAGAYIGGLNYTALFRLVAEFLCAAFCCGFLYSKYFKGTAKSTLTKELARKMDSFSFQMMFTNGLWAIFMLNDVFLIGQLSGSETVLAEYKIAYVVPANLSILVSAIGIFVAPYFTKYEHSGNYDWIRRYFKVVLKITMLIMGMASIVCFLLAKPIILVMYGNAYLPAVPIMRVLLVASFFNNGIRASIANILSATGMQKSNLAVAVVGIVLQVVIDILLIPRYGGIGVAISSSFVYISMSIMLSLVVRKKFFTRQDIQHI